MKKNNFLFIAACFLLLFSLQTKGQIAKTDSLRKLINKETEGERKNDLLLLLSTEFRDINPDSSFNLSQEILKSSGSKNSELRLKADLNKIFYYIKRSKADTGLSMADKNIVILKQQIRNDSLLAQYQSVSGFSLMKLNRQKEALEQFYKALNTSEGIKDIITQSKTLHQIGWAYMELNQFEEAINYFKLSIRRLQENKLPADNPSTYVNMASCFGALGKLDSAYHYIDKGIKTAKLKNNLTVEANAWFIKGNAYMEEKKYEEALKCFLNAKPLREKTGDPFYIVSDMAVMSELYALMGRTDEGIQTGKEAFNIAEKEKIDAKYPIIYRSMAMNYEKAGDFKMASEIYKKLNEVQDKIYTNASQEALAEMQTKYETEKKECIIQEQEFNLKRKNYFIIGISILFLLALLVGWLIYNRIQLKQKAKLQTALYTQQQLAAQSVLTAEENERQRIAKDLHDGVGQMMSVAKMNLSAFENEITFLNEDQKLSFERIISLIDESCKEVRLVSHQMMPNILLKSGLAKAIADFIDKIDQRVLKVQLHTEGLNVRLHENIEIVLYRVLQECVNNVIKHAGATHLDISLIHDHDGISVTIEDNGKGFLMNEISDQSGLGLKNMKARVEYLKGEIDFNSTPGKGTLVAIHIPTTNKEIL